MKICKNIVIHAAPLIVIELMAWFGFSYPNAAASICRDLGAPAVVLAGFSAAAFNLRFRMLDAVQKSDLKRSQVQHLEKVFNDCRVNIDRCLVLFVVTTLILIIGKYSQATPFWVQPGLLSLGSGLFVYCLIQFLQILRALRMVEAFVFDQMKKNAKTL